MNGINISTGEIITEEAPLAVKSEALKLISIKIKELQDIEKALKSIIEQDVEVAVQRGETTLEDYWEICEGRMTFDKETFERVASAETKSTYNGLKKRIREIESRYKKVGKPFLKHPKY